MTTQQTTLPPGPYRSERGESEDTYRIFAAGESKPFAELIYIGGTEDFADTAKAIARLFTAGPRLLEALTLMVRWTEKHKLNIADLITGQKAEVPVVTIARKAIAEATKEGA